MTSGVPASRILKNRHEVPNLREFEATYSSIQAHGNFRVAQARLQALPV